MHAYKSPSIQEKLSLTDVLNQTMNDGITTILCETIEEIQAVESEVNLFLTTNSSLPKDDLLTVYNPDEPHLSKRSAIKDFLNRLESLESHVDRKGEKTKVSIAH